MTTNHAIVTGAGSGVGQAIALALAARGWSVSLIGRRAEALAETTRKPGANAMQLDCYPLDIADAGKVAATVKAILAKRGGIHALVNAAGTNVPRRSLEVLNNDDWRAVIDANLNGAYFMVNAVLPAMRAQKNGIIVNVVSDAGLRANAKAGPSYVASKFALNGLTQSINCEEQKNGIRACAIHPGDINTPILDKRPVPPPAEARANMLTAEDVAACALLAIELPPRAVVEELVIRPRATA
jgi:NAD(P)-dependent dehydrogenase (short-subunit alcohol dehydrogenase family)